MVDNAINLTTNSRVAVVFPGQGAQSVGMLAELSDTYPEIMNTFNEASDALGFDLWEICQDEALLAQTQYTQPALLTASTAIWRILQNKLFNHVGQPVFLAGHSLGEYSALCASGAMSLANAVNLVHKRGQLMQDAVIGQEVMMAAVLGLEEQQVINICEQTKDLHDEAIVDAANFNSPGQVVIAGNKVGVEIVIHQVKDNLGKKAIPLKVSVPSHCALMNPASEAFEKVLSQIDFVEPTIPVIQNRHAKKSETVKNIRQALVEQLNNPVLWTQTMQQLADKKVDVIIECGNGNVLSNLTKRQETPISAFPTDKLTRIDKLLSLVSESL